jgi:hypothetical protein
MSLRAWLVGNSKIWRDRDGNLLGYTEQVLSQLTGLSVPSQGDYLGRLKWEIQTEAVVKKLMADALIAELEKEQP